VLNDTGIKPYPGWADITLNDSYIDRRDAGVPKASFSGEIREQFVWIVTGSGTTEQTSERRILGQKDVQVTRFGCGQFFKH
jgi:hypothetical protein